MWRRALICCSAVNGLVFNQKCNSRKNQLAKTLDRHLRNDEHKKNIWSTHITHVSRKTEIAFVDNMLIVRSVCVTHNAPQQNIYLGIRSWHEYEDSPSTFSGDLWPEAHLHHLSPAFFYSKKILIPEAKVWCFLFHLFWYELDFFQINIHHIFNYILIILHMICLYLIWSFYLEKYVLKTLLFHFINIL